MTNWKLLAQALEIHISDDELSRVSSSLDGLESAFAPLGNRIPADVEPAVTFRAEPERGFATSA